ncbi:hypothetical protein JOQ06_020124 [Pogonophryne albipinna]|uniref:Uncharacterized protein n=1 Tax=Pogonophryne albipinna TaxID=1090488 RepID=A0AAD6FVA3_9TELE|nr:hypothetical protein JOQ06_020124 [Pogonophryne albipinna]
MDVLLRVLLSLSALAGIHSITTVSEVSVRAGGSITIPCLYESNVPVDLNAYIIPLSLLIFIVLVTVFIWFMLKRHKQTKEAASAMTASSPAESAVDVVYSSVIPMKQQHVPKAEEEIIYCNVRPKRKSSSQAEEDVTCNVGIMTKTSSQVEAEDNDVTYEVGSALTENENVCLSVNLFISLRADSYSY